MRAAAFIPLVTSGIAICTTEKFPISEEMAWQTRVELGGGVKRGWR